MTAFGNFVDDFDIHNTFHLTQNMDLDYIFALSKSLRGRNKLFLEELMTLSPKQCLLPTFPRLFHKQDSATTFAFIVVLLLPACCSVALAQQDGIPPFSIAEQHEIDTINLVSLTPVLNVKVVSKSGLIPFEYTLTAAQSCGVTGQYTQSLLSCSNSATFTGMAIGMIGSDLAYTTVVHPAKLDTRGRV